MKDFKSPDLLPLLLFPEPIKKTQETKQNHNKKEANTQPMALLSTLLPEEIIPDRKTSLEDEVVQEMNQAKSTTQASPEEPQNEGATQ